MWMPSSAISTGRRSSSATHKRSGSPPPEPIGFPKERRSAMKWVTRERPKIDRIACPWLITRRSEEHTSELQSLMRISYAVFCLKKKKQKTHNTTSDNALPTHYTCNEQAIMICNTNRQPKNRHKS